MGLCVFFSAYTPTLQGDALQQVVKEAADKTASSAGAAVENLSEWFPMSSLDVLSNACVLDPKNLPPASSADPANYGKENWGKLCAL